MELFSNIISKTNTIVWSGVLVILCLAVGIYLSVRMKFPQIRLFREMVRLLLKADSQSEHGITPFQAFATTVGSRVGMGSVAGVAAGIYFGGPGAVFWMWALGLLGAATALMEATLAQAYKTKVNGEYIGGPSLFIERGLKVKAYAIVFSVVTIVGVGVMMPGLHANSIASTFQRSFGTSMITGGVILCVFLALVVFGGVKRIGKFAEKAAPFMCLVYMIMALGILVIHFNQVPAALGQIFTSAFGADALFGGIVGSAIAWGVKRGVYSTEAGLGSGAIVSAAAESSHPAKQGLIQALSVYIVSFIVCTSTAVILLVGKSYNVINEATGEMIVEFLPGSEYGVGWTQDLLETAYGSLLGGKLFAIIIALFVFTSLIGYSYQVESNMAYLFKGNKVAVTIMRIVFVLSTFSGVLFNADLIWTLGDTGAGMMAWLNIVAVILLSGKGVAIFKDYEKQKKQGIDPVFHPEEFGIDDPDGIWKRS